MGILRIVILILLLSVSQAFADGYHWSRPTGTSTTWANCRTDTDTPPADNNANYCTRAAVNSLAVAGDTVYYRAGTYPLVNVTAIQPANSGTGSGTGRIIFSNYNGEEVIWQQGVGSVSSAIVLGTAKNWIKITGMDFRDVTGDSTVGSSYNEVSYCKFTHPLQASAASRVFTLGVPTAATHNWIHHNYFSTKYGTSPCTEGIDILRIGMATQPDPSHFNTVEYNYFEYSAHANIVTYSQYNVIRNNIGHNEPWIYPTDLCTSYDGTMLDNEGLVRGDIYNGSLTLSVESKSFTISTGLPVSKWVAGRQVFVFLKSDWTKGMYGNFTSYNTDTGDVVINITTVIGGVGETYNEDWILTTKNVPKYTTAAWDGLYSHRVTCFGDVSGYAPNHFNLIEGNRFGFAGVNPNNNGGNALDIGSKRNIVRYNSTYGNAASGISMKGGAYNYIYNNTSYGNGTYDYTIYGSGTINTKGVGQGIAQYSGAGELGAPHTENIIKNNLVYSNRLGDICYSKDGQVAECTAWHGDTVENNWTTLGVGQGDPLFINPSLADPTSQNLFSTVHGYTTVPIPDLRLQSGSSAINGGTYLTTAHGAGISSATLVAHDAGYFFDGRRGASIAGHTGDWIAVGTVGNVAQISQVYQLLTLGVAPGGAGWAAADTITGIGGGVNTSASGTTCVIVEKLTDLTYNVKDCTGVYDYGETLTNGVASAVQGTENTETMTLNVAPGGAGWSVGETIRGVTSGTTSVILTKASSTSYTIRSRSGPYTLGEVLTNETDTADQGTSYPITSTLVIRPILTYSNTMLLSSPLTWADDASIWLYKKSDGTRVLYGSAPEYGAYEFYPTSMTIGGGTQTLTIGTGSATLSW